MKLNSFIKQFVAVVKGDDAEALAIKTQRTAESGLKSQIAQLQGDLIGLEDEVENAEESHKLAIINNGEPLSTNDRNKYVQSIIDTKIRSIESVEALEEHKLKIEVLEKALAFVTSKDVIETLEMTKTNKK